MPAPISNTTPTTQPSTPTTPPPAPSLEAVRSGAVVKRGQVGDAVKFMQEKLGLTADGKFGPGTETALKAFQQANGLTADGKMGKGTLEKLSAPRTNSWTPSTTPATPATPTAPTAPTTPTAPAAPASGLTPAQLALGKTLAAAGAQSIDMRMKAHNDSIDRTGVGTLFGDHSAWKTTMTPAEKEGWLDANMKGGWKDWTTEQRTTHLKANLPSFKDLTPEQQKKWNEYPDNRYRFLPDEQKKQWLEDNVKPFDQLTPDQQRMWVESPAMMGTHPPLGAQPKESSCIGWAMENVGAAYAAAGKSERFREITKIVRAKDMDGTILAQELQKDGWQAVYWNPDTRNPNDGNPEHPWTAARVAKGKDYYGVKPDAQVINYRPSGQGNPPTVLDNSGMEKLKKVPFFFGVAKGGYHTFVGRNGNVNEFHWADMPDSHRAIQETPLNQWGWNSGIIMVPPGQWPTN